MYPPPPPYNHAPCHFMQSHIRKVYACSAATCHLHFGQNDRDLLRATAVTRGSNGYRNKSQHRKLTPEKKIIPLLIQGFEPATFQSRVRRSNHRVIPGPYGKLIPQADTRVHAHGHMQLMTFKTGQSSEHSVQATVGVSRVGPEPAQVAAALVVEA